MLVRRLVPVNAAQRPFQHGQIGGFALVLRRAGAACRSPTRLQRAQQQVCATHGETGARSAPPRFHPGRWRRSSLQQHVAGIHAAYRSYMVVTPVRVSPLMRHQLMGAEPRYSGSSDAWTLIVPSGGMSSTCLGKDLPEGRRDKQIRLERFQRLASLRAADALKLQHGDAMLQCADLDRRRA